MLPCLAFRVLLLRGMDIPGARAGELRFPGFMAAATTDHGARMVEDLLHLGIAISSEGELAPVLERIGTQARRLTGAEPPTPFLREDAQLRFAALQNAIRKQRLGGYRIQQRLEVDRL